MKDNKTTEEAKQWVSDLLYENGVHQSEAHIFDKAENKIEEYINRAKQQCTQEIVEMIESKKVSHKGHVNYYKTNGYNQAIDNLIQAIKELDNNK